MCKAKRILSKGFLFFLIFMSMGWVEQAQSQEKYPTRAIDIIVPFKPAGGTDMATRVIVPFLSKKWGVPLNVVNKPGANTLAGTVDVYDAVPNGYTLLADCPASSSMLGVIIKDIPFKIMDRTFIGMMSEGPGALMIPSTSPWKSLKDVEVGAKIDPEHFTWVSLGGVSGPDLVTRQFLKAIGVDVSKTKPVMGTGGADVATLVAGGHVKFGSTNIISAKAAIQAGLIRLLAVARVRDSEFPDVPTTAELGYPTVNNTWWVGFSGPPKMPPYIVNIWDKALKEIARDPEYVTQLKRIGFAPFYQDLREMKEYIIREAEEVAELYGKRKE
jgi:tripartite-type tricarboxylate transporter receptor subunit TctC